MDYFLVFIRAVGAFILLFIVTKIIGKKQVSELSLFDYAIGISIGNFAAEMTVNLEQNYLYGVIAVISFGIISYLVSYVTMNSINLRRFFMGIPTVVIQNGNIIKSNLIKSKLDINDLLEQCRGNGYFDISEIDYAIFEANGKLSILPKAPYKGVINKDMKIKSDKSSLCANIIIDGKIIKNNLYNMKKDINWIEKELKIRGFKLSDVLLATLDNSEKLNFYLDEDIVPLEILE